MSWSDAVRLAALVAALGLAASIAGCSSGAPERSGDARKGGSIVVALTASPGSLDPALASSPAALQAVWQVYTPPVTFRHSEGADGTDLVPGLAEAMPKVSEDGQSVSFRFRKGLRYSSGRAVRASDFARGIRRARRISQAARRAFADIEEIATDDHRRAVMIALRRPRPAFVQALALPAAAPLPPGPLVGVGPYRFVRHRRGTAYVLARRRGLRLPGIPQGNLEVIAARVVSGRGAAARGVVLGRYDEFDGEPPREALPEIRSKYKDRYEENRTTASQYLRMDLRRRPFSDVDIRRAVSMALDERAMARLRDGFLAPSCNVLPPQVPGYRPPSPCPFGDRQGNSDLEGASQLVRRSPARRTRVVVAPGTVSGGRRLARYVASTLAKVGLRARVARSAQEVRGARLVLAEADPLLPNPAAYLGPVRDAVTRAETARLAAQGTPADLAAEWAALDADVVTNALVAPYGVRTTGSLFSERLDAINCSRFHPLFGVDLSSLCLR